MILNDGFKEKELNYIQQYLRKRREYILARWLEIQEIGEDHGD